MASALERAIKAELDALAPPTGMAPAWADVLERAGVVTTPRLHVPVPTSRRRRPTTALAAVSVALALAGIAVPTLALSSTARRLVGLDVVPTPVFARATLVLEVPADRGQEARLYSAPSSTGGTCWFVHRVSRRAPLELSSANSGGVCSVGAPAIPPATSAPMTWALAMQPRTSNNVRGWRAPVLDGWVNPRVGARSVSLEWRGGSVRLPFARDRFLYVSAALYRPPRSRLPFELVARDATGDEVARVRIPKTALYVR